jgi:hydrogenase maturation factor
LLIFSDPQTSGGLLIAASPAAAEFILAELQSHQYPLACADIGEIMAGGPGQMEIITRK